MADGTLFPHAFGLKKPAPLWTAPALDRCPLLALIYPIAAIFLIWAISGHVGPAEAALGLMHDVPGWRRGLGLLAAAVGIYCCVLVTKSKNQFLALVVGPVGFAAFVVVGAFSSIAIASAAGLVSFFGVVLSVKSGRSARHGRLARVVLGAMVLVCPATADTVSYQHGWRGGFGVGPLLLFLVLLTLLNAPFDWASLGLTRALLRRGLELGGWWSYVLALVDAFLGAPIVIALLALTVVLGVQAFDELAVHGGGEKAAVLRLPALFDGIGKNPGAQEYWWAYALLLSTMIPSVINLAISGMAFTRGIPGVSRLLLNWIPEGRDVPEDKQQPAAIGLTIQMFTGAFLGIAAQALLAWGLIFHLMPAIGLDLLDMARAVAKFDVPLRAYQLFAGNL